jgi:hypothetical protein
VFDPPTSTSATAGLLRKLGKREERLLRELPRWNQARRHVPAGWGHQLAGKLNGREGFVFPETFRTSSRPGGAGRAEVLFDPLGTTRLEHLWVADFRLEKQFEFGGARRLSAIMDIFNLFNEPTVLGRERRRTRRRQVGRPVGTHLPIRGALQLVSSSSQADHAGGLRAAGFFGVSPSYDRRFLVRACR